MLEEYEGNNRKFVGEKGRLTEDKEDAARILNKNKGEKENSPNAAESTTNIYKFILK